MLVPRPRLLQAVAVAVVPLAALAGREETFALAAAGLALCAGVAGLDAWLGRAALDGIEVQLPPLVRWQKEEEGSLPLQVWNRRRRGFRLRVGLPFPPEITCAQEELETLLPAGQERSTLEWRGEPHRRGSYPFTLCSLEAASPLGLWSWRRRVPVAGEVRVYPNFLTERKHVAALFLNRGHSGIHAMRQAGRGRDFEKLREYVPGDSMEDISWKATARRGRPVTKVYQVERTQEVYVILDCSRLMARDPDFFERYLTAGLLLAIAAEQQGDHFGMIAFSDRVHHFVRAKAGKTQFQVCRDAFYAVQPRPVTPDFDELATFLQTKLRKRSLLVFLTALDDPVLSESFERAVRLLCRQHLIFVNMLQPPLARPLFTREVAALDDLYQDLGGHLLWQELRELGQRLLSVGARFSLLQEEALSARLLSQYMEVKARQLL